MKTGRTLQELAAELERQQAAKKDYVADTRSLQVENDANTMLIEDVGDVKIGDMAHHQMATRLEIPQRYYDRMLSNAPALLAENINHWFQVNPQKRMIRTLDGKARAFLSSRYRPLDNYDLAQAVLPQLGTLGGDGEVVSCEVTEKKMFIKVITKRLTAEIKQGDIVQAGISISNSEVGCGSVSVSPMLYRLVCLNGMIANDNRLRKYHVGKDDSQEGASRYYKTETRIASDKAFWMKVRDVVAGSFDEVEFNLLVAKMQRTTEMPITADPVKVVENVSGHFGFNETEKGGVLRHLISGGDLTAYGMLNAITRFSQDETVDYDRATDLEMVGGRVIELGDTEWSNLNKVA